MNPIAELSDAITSALVGRLEREAVELTAFDENVFMKDLPPEKDAGLDKHLGGDVVKYGPAFYVSVAKAIRRRKVTSYGDIEVGGKRAFWAKAGDDVYMFPGLGRLGAEPERVN